jgi:hypothetical protein
MKTTPLLPLILLYVTGTALALFGPIEYYNIDREAISVFMTIAVVLLVAGFKAGTRWQSPRPLPGAKKIELPLSYKIALSISLCHSATLFALSIAQGGLSAISFSAGAEQYADLYDQYTRNSGNTDLSWLLSEMIYPFHVATISWTVYFFSKLTQPMKILGGLALALIVIRFGIMSGKQKFIGDVVILSGFVFLATHHGVKISGRRIAAAFSVLVIGLCVMIAAISQRYALAGITYENVNERSIDVVNIEDNLHFIPVLGPELGFGLIKTTQYLSSGYYGLSIALSLPFEWTWMIGHSYTLMVLYNRFFGGEFLFEKTYAYRAGDLGWSMEQWHTAFTWYASDLTFPGALVFFFLAAFFYGRLWRAVAVERRALAVPLYGYLSIGFVFVPANNQLMISPGGVLTLVLGFLLWFASKRPGKTSATEPNLPAQVP